MNDEELMTADEVGGRVEWEGGIIPALNWGLKPEMIEPGELRDAWAALWEAYYGSFRDLELDVEELLEEEE